MTPGRTKSIFLLILIAYTAPVLAQPGGVRWSQDGNAYYRIESNEINRYDLPANAKTAWVTLSDLTPAGQSKPLAIRAFYISTEGENVLLYTNSKRVWRSDTRGDYWVLNRKAKTLRKLGNGRPESSLMFAKFSPDGLSVAYVSEQNLYLESLNNGTIQALTTDGSRKLINGTFDWVYEEELACRDGFQWSPDSKHIAYWQIDANKVRDYYMLNTTDSVYSKVVRVEYPTIGQSPSPARIGVIDVGNGKTSWLDIPGDPGEHYLPRLCWYSPTEIFVQQLNRKQNESKIFTVNPATGHATNLYTETDPAWIDLYAFRGNPRALDFQHPWIWLSSKKEFLWMSEKDGWSHIYRVARDGARETLITKGDYDVIDFQGVDEKNKYVYFLASPASAVQKYLYRTKLDGKGSMERVTPAGMEGTHDYDISPNGKFAMHSFSNASTRQLTEWIDLASHKPLNDQESIQAKLPTAALTRKVEFFKVRTREGIEMDGWMVKPKNFDPNRKYPLVFFVYSEPASQTVLDRSGTGSNRLYKGDMADDGYIYMSVDGRGTPAPKGRAWRKAIYRKIGVINIRDQALAAQEILKWPWVDPERVAVWGWSGGGSTTLNLLFQYPDIYKTGIAVAAVANQLTYDNIYQERYMGLPSENLQDILDGSPLTYARNLKGNLLYIHGTGDDNVHYNNAEMLVNELIKYNKQFQVMPYPNRTHGISEGEGTNEHLKTLYTEYLKKNCPPGGR